MPASGDARTVREALSDSFRAGGLPEDGGYSAAWVWLRVGRFCFPLPNIPARRRAVRYHDLHHLITGYDTSWRGEAAIGAFELASGCGRYWVGWLLDGAALPIGVVLAPRATFRAFCRGRRSDNLFGADYDELARLTVGELRARVHLAGPDPRPRVGDLAAFLAFLLAGTALWVLPVAALVLAIALLVV